MTNKDLKYLTLHVLTNLSMLATLVGTIGLIYVVMNHRAEFDQMIDDALYYRTHK